MINIDELTADAILEDGIFKKLFEIKDDVERVRIIHRLTVKAKELKVKSDFTELLSAYKKAFDKKCKDEIELQIKAQYQNLPDTTEFANSPYDPMACGNWICNENGITTIGGLGQEIIACYHPIIPVKRYINNETGKEKIKIAFKKNNTWQDIVVEKGVIASANKIVQLAEKSVSVTSESARYLVKYLSDIENLNIDRIPVQKSTSKLGWINGSFIPFDDEYKFDAESSFKEAYECICESGSEEEWLKLVKDVRKTGRIEPKISIAATLASVLIKPLNALPFILNIGGPTGQGKTVSMMVAVSCWANPAENKYMTDCKSTVTALELNLDFLNNLPMFLDDMSQVKEKHQGDFTGLIYMLCSGKGKDRANVNLGLNKRTTWKNIILTNYEYSLATETMQGGAINRIIDVEMDDGAIFDSSNGNRTVGIVSQNYGFAGREFLDAIEELGMDEIKRIQKEAYDAIVKKAKEKDSEKEEKQILPMSIILTADYIATKYIFKDDEYLDFERCVDTLKDKGEVSENERAYQFIQSEIAINANKFVPSDPINGTYKGEIWGRIEDGYAIIINNAYETICKKGNFSSRSFLSWAKKKELLDCADNRLKKQKWVGGTKNYCVCLKLIEKSKDEPQTDEDGFVKISEDAQGDLPFL